MEPTFRLPQALAARHGDMDVRWLAESPDFPEEAKPMLAELAVQFGPRPPGQPCAEAVLALPLKRQWVVLARVQDLGSGEPPLVLGFQFLLLTPRQYEECGCEAFRLLCEIPEIWSARGTVGSAPARPAMHLRSLADLELVLKRPDSPLLLGATQALLDGSRLVLRRSEPATDLFAALWQLLPYRTARELRLATFAFSNQLDLHLLALPATASVEFDFRYLSQDQAEHYPEGRYELALQIAVEAGEEGTAQRLLLRRTRTDTLWLGLGLLLGMLAIAAAFSTWKLLRG